MEPITTPVERPATEQERVLARCVAVTVGDFVREHYRDRDLLTSVQQYTYETVITELRARPVAVPHQDQPAQPTRDASDGSTEGARELLEALQGMVNIVTAFSHTNTLGKTQCARLDAARAAIAKARAQ